MGACAFRDPRLDILSRRLRWLSVFANHTGLAGIMHRALATDSGSFWTEPSPALATAVREARWSVCRNMECAHASHWPPLHPELSYRCQVVMEPQSSMPPPDAIWTDGSVLQALATSASAALASPRCCVAPPFAVVLAVDSASLSMP